MASNVRSGNKKNKKKDKNKPGKHSNGDAQKAARWDTLIGHDDVADDGRCEWKESEMQLFDSDFQDCILYAENSGIGCDFDSAHKQHGLKIWRISDYKALHWPEEQYGHFYEDEVFLAQHSERTVDGTRSRNHIHLWVGKGVKNDTMNYPTGAHKASELDEKLKFEGEIHREIQGKESMRFRSYFKPFVIWRGSSKDSYFNDPEKTRSAQLLRLYRPDRRLKNFVLKEVPADKKSLVSENIFFLDLGKSIIQWNGSYADEADRKHALKYLHVMKRGRGGKIEVEQIQEETIQNHTFHAYLDNKMDFSENGVDSDDEGQARISMNASKLKRPQPRIITPQIKREELLFSIHKEGNISMPDFKKHAVCIFDKGDQCFVWIGKRASLEERRMAVEFGHEYLRTTDHPLVPFSVVKEDIGGREFKEALASM